MEKFTRKIKRIDGECVRVWIFLIIASLLAVAGVATLVMWIVALIVYGGKPVTEIPTWAVMLLRISK